MRYYPAVPLFHVMVVFSGTRVVRVVCVVMVVPCCVVACVCVGVAAECDRLRHMARGSASTNRFMFVIMTKRRDSANSASAINNNLNMR